MKTKLTLILALFTGMGIAQNVPQTQRTKTCINTGWKFYHGNAEADFYLTETDDSAWETVSVPHTLKLTSIALDHCEDDKYQKTFHREVGWYRKNIRVTSNPDKKVFLEFEGVHQRTLLWVNGKPVGEFAVGGYSPFHFDISDFVTRGASNQITVMADNRVSEVLPPDPGMFDYIKFSGLYRDVYLLETDPLHITFNWEALNAGIHITTPLVNVVCKTATVNVKTTVRNEYNETKKAKVIQHIIDREGLVVVKMEAEAMLASGADYQFNQIASMEDEVTLWSIENPYLYRVNTVVELDGKPVDMVENKMGLRHFYLDNERGFILNNEPIELIGFNRHQHYGYIGDALPNSLHYKDMLQFKQLGFNVMRTAHYPQDNAILEACDELGILVYEEAPTWIGMSNNPLWWENYEEAARRMVRNHRNHPSVVIWGAGINHRGYVPRATNAIKQEDPFRLTASQSSRWTGWQASGLTDIFGNMMYGPGIWDRSETLLAMEGGRGPKTVAEYKRDPKKTGIISWTAHAYYTFHPGNNPNNRARGGSMSIFRQPRKEILWYPSEMRREPYLYIADQWKEGITQMDVFSNADKIELLVNNGSIGTYKPSSDESYKGLYHPPFEIPVVRYEDGKLEVRGYVNDTLMLSKTIYTPGKAKSIELVADTTGRKWEADGADLLVAYARVLDGNGMLVRDYQGEITFSVKGDAGVLGDKADIGANPIRVENGEAPVLLRAGINAGMVTLSAKSKGLKSGMAGLQTVPKNNNMVESNILPFYDFERIRVDLGSPEQLVQFGWTQWSNPDNEPAETSLDFAGGISASIKANSDNGILRWLGEMNVIGKYGFVYGEGVIGIDDKGITLAFDGLPAGTYRLVSYHHAPRSNSDSMDPNRERLKQETIHKLPYANELEVSVNGQSLMTSVSNGQEMQYAPVATSAVVFEADGTSPVKVVYKDPKAEKGIWLNGFELSQWDKALK